jgi:hypothetical protein
VVTAFFDEPHSIFNPPIRKGLLLKVKAGTAADDNPTKTKQRRRKRTINISLQGALQPGFYSAVRHLYLITLLPDVIAYTKCVRKLKSI